MAWLEKLISVSFLVVAAAINGASGDAMVTGTVFCDQCKDGERSLFDYPIYGAKVEVTCTDGAGQTMVSREETTNWFGNYAVRFDGAPDLSGCYARVSDGGGQGCAEVAGPAQQLRLMFRMFDMEMYVVDSLLAQPSQPMSNCPTSTRPVVSPAPPVNAPVTPVNAPVTPVNAPVTPVNVPVAPPAFRLPPLPQLPPMPPLPPLPALPPMPPMPFVEATACSHENWTMPEYRCYWRTINPDTKVSTVFGPVAVQRFGPDVTLWHGLQGRGDPHRTLLREAITSLLNSRNTLAFPYGAVGVVQRTDLALVGSPRDALFTALRFKRANSGYGNAPCKFTPCK